MPSCSSWVPWAVVIGSRPRPAFRSSATTELPSQHACWKSDHFGQFTRARREHEQAIETERVAPSARHAADQPRKKAFVDSVGRTTLAGAAPRVVLEASALFERIGELVEAIAQLDAAHVQLEAFGNTRIIGRQARERRLIGRVFPKK